MPKVIKLTQPGLCRRSSGWGGQGLGDMKVHKSKLQKDKDAWAKAVSTLLDISLTILAGRVLIKLLINCVGCLYCVLQCCSTAALKVQQAVLRARMVCFGVAECILQLLLCKASMLLPLQLNASQVRECPDDWSVRLLVPHVLSAAITNACMQAASEEGSNKASSNAMRKDMLKESNSIQKSVTALPNKVPSYMKSTHTSTTRNSTGAAADSDARFAF